jgi:hypothetical protein
MHGSGADQFVVITDSLGEGPNSLGAADLGQGIHGNKAHIGIGVGCQPDKN